MQLQQITFSREVKETFPDKIKFVANPKALTGAKLIIVLKKGAVFYFEVTKATDNQLQTDRPVFGSNSYVFYNYCERLENDKQMRMFIVDDIDGLE